MKKNLINSFKIMAISTLTLSMVACSGNKTAITTEDFAINSSEIESNDGNYNITLEFYEKSPSVKYTIYENNIEIKSDEKDDSGKYNTDIIIKDNANGEYLYTVKVEDNNSGIINKEVKVNVKKDEVNTEVNNNHDDDKDDINEVDRAADWSSKSVEYMVNDEVSYEGKTYECLQSHISQADWTPVDASSLWKIED